MGFLQTWMQMMDDNRIICRCSQQLVLLDGLPLSKTSCCPIVSEWNIPFTGIELLKWTPWGFTRSHQGCHQHIYNGHACRGGRQMGGGRGPASLCHCKPPSTIVAADECGAGRLSKGQCGFVAVDIWVVSRSYTLTSQKLPTSASISRQVEGRGSGPFVSKPAVMTSEPCLPPQPSNPQSHPSPQPLCIYSYTVVMTTLTFHPLAQALTSVIN